METIDYHGNLRNYLKMPIYMILIFLLGNVGLYFYDIRIGIAVSVFVLIYSIVVYVFYRLNIVHINEEIQQYALNYDEMQKELMEKYQVPYALIDQRGRCLWLNEEFSELVEKEKNYSKSITSIFPEVTAEYIEKSKENEFELIVNYEKRLLRLSFKRIHLPEKKVEKAIDNLLMRETEVIALMVYDETQLFQLRQDKEDEAMVAALVYIDNYEDAFAMVEDVKRSLLTAVIDRKINKYFQCADGIVRKIEKDKYFVFFQHKYLKKLEEGKFSILEDIKGTKVGNDMEITLSIGIGVGGAGYQENAEYARAAIDIALGRGGSQAVIKEGERVSYYGSRGKEIEKTTRVKARVKALALREMMENRENVIVMGHAISDVDSFGAAIGVYCAARELGKPAQIVLNTVTSSLRPLVECFSVEAGYPEDMFIGSDEAISNTTDNTLVMVVDTNRPNYTDCPRLLEKCHSVVVFDHHRQGSEVIQNPLLSYIEPYASSACEMIAEVLQYFSEKVQLNPIEADCIYAGVLIDTNNFMTKTGVRTFEAAAYLRRCGAEVTRVRKLLREDMSAYKARAEIVRHAQVYRNAFAISICEPGQIESPTVIGAKAANELLNIVGIKASFVLTEFQHKVYVSSRSIDEIDVQLIMERLGGGGHLNVAGAQLENISLEEAKLRIQQLIDELIQEGEIVL